ncbi:hypothetical protein QTG54_006986 [Skeletonema marinoi]|uniref:Uncharacterized protein n=1 Tax=Skeletonema marinoi TaxID=267567 RepID=A0AAD9DCF0_9STRA|nr:hypothetical protein QTG54_006986 [Skeletonema marinoi]
MIQVGLPIGDQNPIVPMGMIAGKELEIVGSHGCDASDMPKILSLVESGKLDPKKLIEREVTPIVVMDVWGDDFAENLGLIDNNTADSDEHHDNEGDESDDYDDDGEFVGEGECQLCERAVKLTRHHLIPKTTWSRIKKRLWNAASTIETYHSLDDEISHEKKEFIRNKLEKMLGMTDISDIPKAITHDSVRSYLFKLLAV